MVLYRPINVSASHPPIIGVKKHVPKGKRKFPYFTEVKLASEGENPLPLKKKGPKFKRGSLIMLFVSIPAVCISYLHDWYDLWDNFGWTTVGSTMASTVAKFWKKIHSEAYLLKLRVKFQGVKIQQKQSCFKMWLQTIANVKVHLTPNTVPAKSDLTFFRNIWNFFEQQYNLKFDTLCLMTELVKGMGLTSIWRLKLFCMHVHQELMPCKWVCDVKSGIESGPC